MKPQADSKGRLTPARIAWAMERLTAGDSVPQVARALGVGRTQLYRKLREAEQYGYAAFPTRPGLQTGLLEKRVARLEATVRELLADPHSPATQARARLQVGGIRVWTD